MCETPRDCFGGNTNGKIGWYSNRLQQEAAGCFPDPSSINSDWPINSNKMMATNLLHRRLCNLFKGLLVSNTNQ